ncbi:MAG: LysM peptidoglycan-binding domain-containing protein, partial [Pseudomonadales bacterium]
NKRAGKPTDFWNLRLPRETRAYVPKLLALAEIVRQPELYDIALAEVEDAPYFTAVDTGGQIDLAQAASLAGIENDEIYLLNPGFNRWATAPDGPHQLFVPIASASKFTAALQELDPAQRVSWTRYKIKSGDSLSAIASKHGTTATVIKEVNNLSSNTIRANHTLMIPVSAQSAKSYALSLQQRKLRKANRYASGKRIYHRVKSGESLWTISRRYGVSIAQLASWNSMVPRDPLKIGRRLTIWKGKQVAQNAPNQTIRKLGYRVRNGDSLYAIAQRFRVSTRDIVKWNSLNKNDYLQPGQAITLFVDVRNTI